MSRLLLLGAALGVLLTACGDEPEPEPVSEPADAARTPERIVLDDTDGAAASPPEGPRDARAIVTDTLGTFEGAVTGIAVWEHPELAYEGAVLAANGEAGLAIVSIDAEVPMRTVEGTFDGGVAVAYPAEGDALVAAAAEGGVTLFRMGADRALAPVGQLETEAAASVCLTPSELVVLTSDGGLTAYPVDASAADPFAASTPMPIGGLRGTPTACATLGDAIYVAYADGWIAAVGDGGEPFFVEGGGATGLAALDLAATQVLLVADEGARLSGIVTATDAADRPVATPTLDGDPVEVVAVAAGSGNFGSLYRDGVVAVLDEGNALHLLPWAGVARAFGLGDTSSVSLRPAVTSPGLDLTLPAPTIEAPALD